LLVTHTPVIYPLSLHDALPICFSCEIDVSWITVPSRTRRTCAPRRTRPPVTYEPAIVPSRDTRKSCRTSTSPIVSSVVTGRSMRSEEHTSELQSLAYLVCRLLL